MSYSDLYFKKQTKPSLLLVVLAVFALVGFGVVFVRFDTTSTRAAKTNLKRNEIVNLMNHQAGIFWTSDTKETGWVIYGDSPTDLSKIALDDRDLDTKKNETLYHYVVIKNLDANKQYYYKIISGNSVYAQVDKSPFTFKTPINFPVNATLKPAYGKVILPNNQPAQNTYVFFKYAEGYSLLAITKPSGEWLIPLQYVIDKKSNKPLPIDENEKVSLQMLNEDNLMTNVDTYVKKTNPFGQTLILGKDYKLFEDTDVLPASTQRSDTDTDQITITYPKEDAVVPGSNPLIKGTALPNKPVIVFINSKPERAFRLTADKKGSWIVNVPFSIAPGSYTLTINTQDSSNKPYALKRQFSIAKIGEQVLGDSTPAATLVPTASPTPLPTITSAPIITSAPTPTAVVAQITKVPTPPVTGADDWKMAVGSFALIVVGAGLVFAF